MVYLRELTGPVIASTGVVEMFLAAQQDNWRSLCHLDPFPSRPLHWRYVRRLVTFCRFGWQSSGRLAARLSDHLYVNLSQFPALCPGFLINLHPAMLHLSVRGTLRSEPRGKKHSINAGLTYPRRIFHQGEVQRIAAMTHLIYKK